MIFFAVTTLLFIILWAVSGEDEIVLIDDITPGTQTDAHYDVLIKNNHFFPIPKKTIKKTIDSMTYTLVIDKAIPGKKSEVLIKSTEKAPKLIQKKKTGIKFEL